ncbi:MAG: hypothetical protein M5R40_29265 [Anaerolineae bacterium]|nr:hypothetical protein [Anaerolineae bacterium]
MAQPTRQPRDPTALLIFCAALLLCLLAYAGRTFLIDDFTLLASAANLGSAGRTDINELAYSHWDLPPPGSLGAFGPSGDYYAKKAPAPAWLAAPLFRLGMAAPWLHSTHAALLLSPLLTAATAALIYDLARRMGYGRGVAAAGGLLYSGASMALVYSRFLLGEPVMAFGLTLALWGAWRAQHEGRAVAGALACGLGVGAAAGGNLALAALAPLFAVYLARRPGALRRLAWMGGALAACLALIGLYNLARFGTVAQSGYHFDAGEGFNAPLWLGVFGLLLSPARGLLWFNPLTWLALPGWLMWRRRNPAEAWLSLAAVGAQVVFFGAWWAWAGGVSWGPRFLLGTAPFLTLALLPVLERARAGGRWRAVAGVVIALAVAVQVIGATADVNVYEGQFSAEHPPRRGRPARLPARVARAGGPGALAHHRERAVAPRTRAGVGVGWRGRRRLARAGRAGVCPGGGCRRHALGRGAPGGGARRGGADVAGRDPGAGRPAHAGDRRGRRAAPRAAGGAGGARTGRRAARPHP